MSPRTARIAVVLAAPLLVLAGCGGGSTKSANAQSGDPAKVNRTVEISMSDGLMFDPATVTVKKGDTVAFRLANTSSLHHEFVVGDAKFQDAHEKEMRAMPADMTMPDEANALDLPAGQTKTINLTFPNSGTVLYGCHEPGHYPAGMKGEIKVT